MTNRLKTHEVRVLAAPATPGSWLMPPIVVPVLLTLIIGARALYLALLS